MVQISMELTVEGNLHGILRGLTEAKRLGGEIAVFAECAVTGFHREMGAEVSRTRIEEVLGAISARCTELGIAAIVGCPFFGSSDQQKPWNAAVVFDSSGQIVGTFPKILFTTGEVRHGVFEPGSAGTRRSFRVAGIDCAILICMELGGEDGRESDEHWRTILTDLLPKPAVVFAIGVWDLGSDSGTLDIARQAALELGSSFVLVNAAEWGGKPPIGCLGRSMAITPEGLTLCEALWNQPCVTLAELTTA